MIMIALRGVLMGAVFPLTGFSEMPKVGSVPQQLGQQMLQQQQQQQQPVQQAMQPQPSAAQVPPDPRLHTISREQIAIMRAMQARFGGSGRNIGPPVPGTIGELPGAGFQSGTTNPAAQQHHQIPSGLSLEVMQALIQRKQDGSG